MRYVVLMMLITAAILAVLLATPRDLLGQSRRLYMVITSPARQVAFDIERSMIKRYEKGDCKIPYHSSLPF